MGILKKQKKSSSSSSSTSPCANLREAYNSCFNRWYSEKFVKGEWDKEVCVSEWQKYKSCLSEHLEEKHLRQILEADEGLIDSNIQVDPANATDGSD